MKKVMLVAALAASALPSRAFSENCRAFPRGPERKSCVLRVNPARFQARLEHCKELSRELGHTRSLAQKEFVQGCMKGKR
jgi:hypothetical protein